MQDERFENFSSWGWLIADRCVNLTTQLLTVLNYLVKKKKKFSQCSLVVEEWVLSPIHQAFVRKLKALGSGPKQWFFKNLEKK